jgi:type II secretory ATPase GspE/PulE/Tfp pilus assembly ATPase PilB-like protein
MSDAARSADAERFPTGATPAAPTPETTLLLAREGNGSSDHLTARCRETVQCPPAALVQAIRARLGQYLDHPEVVANLKPMEEWSLAAQGRLAETDILQAYTVASGLGVLEEEELELAQKHPDVSLEFLTEHLCLPLLWDAEAITLAVATPYQLGALAFRWRQLFGLKSRFILCRRSQLERSLAALYEGRGDEGGLDKLDLHGDASEETLRDLALEAPIVRLVNDMFTRAIEMGASDIHVEPAEETLTIRFRVDGILQTVSNPPIASYPAISSRLKLIGGLNIAERRLPQDGRTDLRVGRHQVDIRISTVPALHGESIVLRLLPKDIVSYSVEKLGMAEAMRTRFESLIALPHGMILVVGPTGSGKTTTLYCAMRLLNHDDVKIITIEDPIEYQIGGVTQIQVKPSIGLTFAGGLRHIVRQDPDIILVGEIRDRETAEIAIHAALTGHLVLSTLHTNDATGAISRLLDMGVEDFLLSSALVGVLSQRLVRRICETCKGSGLAAEVAASGNKNCRTCSGSGFRGRVGIFELLQMDDDLRQGIRQGLDNAALATIARQHGMKSLREDGERLIGLHITTREEVARVCQLDT